MGNILVPFKADLMNKNWISVNVGVQKRVTPRCATVVCRLFWTKGNVGRRQDNYNVNQATFWDCNMLISPAARQGGHLQNRKISPGIAYNPFPHLSGRGNKKNRVFKWLPYTNKTVCSLWLKPWGTYGLKAGNCQQVFQATYSTPSSLYVHINGN